MIRGQAMTVLGRIIDWLWSIYGPEINETPVVVDRRPEIAPYSWETYRGVEIMVVYRKGRNEAIIQAVRIADLQTITYHIVAGEMLEEQLVRLRGYIDGLEIREKWHKDDDDGKWTRPTCVGSLSSLPKQLGEDE